MLWKRLIVGLVGGIIGGILTFNITRWAGIPLALESYSFPVVAVDGLGRVLALGCIVWFLIRAWRSHSVKQSVVKHARDIGCLVALAILVLMLFHGGALGMAVFFGTIIFVIGLGLMFFWQRIKRILG